jgi:uncharacterized membrane protein (DUF485 family)
MTSENNVLLVNSDAYISYVNRRRKFILKLAIFHFALVFVFDIVAIFEPTFFAREIWSGSIFTIGLAYAFVIIASVIISTFYYSHRINLEESRFSQYLKKADRVS